MFFFNGVVCVVRRDVVCVVGCVHGVVKLLSLGSVVREAKERWDVVCVFRCCWPKPKHRRDRKKL